MAVRTAYDAVAGTTLTAANLDKYPGGWIGYAEVTANQTGISSVTDLTSLSVTVTVGTSRRIQVFGFARLTQQTSNGIITFSIRDGSSTTLSTYLFTASTGNSTQGVVSAVLTPSSGSNTYKLSLATTAGTVDMSAGATFPAHILVCDLGPSS